MKAFHFVLTFAALLFAFTASAMHHRQVQAIVVSISSDYGNIKTNVGADGIATLGIEQGKSFSIGFNGKEFKVYFGATYSDVPRGDWIAFVTETGTLQLARNYENAGVTIGVAEGDIITIYN